VLPEDQRDQGDQRLSERRCEQRAGHSNWLEARDDGIDKTNSEYPHIHQIGGVALNPKDANGKGNPDEEKCGGERNTGSGSVRCFFIFMVTPARGLVPMLRLPVEVGRLSHQDRRVFRHMPRSVASTACHCRRSSES
jgi:hypothetical protein